ncbi:hypothetical protein AA0Z99_06635 [Agrococcus sp. 1P02AA]|uniref:hypothetical protein n=1 Tax=Agrococcus sp. 1P02AA TaxID=3132259 RepID=UPI0039A5FFCD
MDEQASIEPSSSADAEARRRITVLAELRRRRNRRRWTVGLAAAAATALIVSGSVVAWSSQARAGDLAGQIEAWHVEHELAGCELTERIVSAVGLERRAQDVLEAAEHVVAADWVLPAAERASLGQHRDAILATIAEGGFVSDDDRELADAWSARADASGDPESFDVTAACVDAAAEQREPIAGVTAERADALARELRALGDPRDFDDARIDRLEAALQQLQAAAISTAELRTDVATLQLDLALAPAEALASLQDSDAHLSALLAVLAGDHTASDALDLVEGLSLHVAAAWMAEAFQLEAQGEVDAAAARAAASQATRDAIAEATPRPITDPGTGRPTPTVPPREESPAPPPETPAPTTPPTTPTTPPPPPTTQPPVEPSPSDPPPTSPEPEPEPEPEPTTPVEPGAGDAPPQEPLPET